MIRKSLLRLAALATIAVAGNGPLLAADYFVAPNGNDGNPGTKAKPWETLGKANKTLQAGDTVYIRAGVYNGRIVPSRSGERGAPIAYEAYRDEKVTVQGNATGVGVVQLKKKQYIVVEDLAIHWKSLYKNGFLANVYITGGGHHVIRNCTIVNPLNYVDQRHEGHKEIGIWITGGTSRNVIEGNVISRMSGHGLAINGERNRIRNNRIVKMYGNAISIVGRNYVFQGNIIEDNLLGGSYVSDGIQTNASFDQPREERLQSTGSRGMVVRNNIIKNNAENAIDLKGAAYWLIEDNLIYGSQGSDDGPENDKFGSNRGGGVAIHKGGPNNSKDIIVRNNVIYDNNGGVTLFNGWKIYNNTLINNVRDYKGPNSTYVDQSRDPQFQGWGTKNWSPRVSVVNNIVGDNGYEGYLKPGPDQTIDYNLYFNTWQKPLFAVNRKDVGVDLYKFAGWQQRLRNEGAAGADANSLLVADAKFVGVADRPTGEIERGRFALASDSPAIDAGRHLTVSTNASDGGRRLKVADPRFFFDGYGVVSGDRIKIGNAEPVRITDIDYADNVVTLEAPRAWGKGAKVNLPYLGTAPDIGAIEFDADGEFGPRAPTGLAITQK